MAQKKEGQDKGKPGVKIQDLSPKKDAKGGKSLEASGANRPNASGVKGPNLSGTGKSFQD